MLKDFYTQNIQRRFARHLNNWRIFRMALRVARVAPKPKDVRPIAFFKASSGLDDFSWNSAFHLLTSWGMRLQGLPVVYFACRKGMSRCVLGTNRDNPSQKPPCASCIYQAKTLYTGAQVNWFELKRNEQLELAVQSLSLVELMRFEFPFPSSRAGASVPSIPLGALVLPGLRWILRRHNLIDDESTRFFLREYILSAWNVAVNFERFLDEIDPQSVVVFNGQFYPEATAKWVAQRRGLRVISHEVGLQPVTAFFTDGEATAYPIEIPESFELTPAQTARLDTYLQKRFQGDFSMAGVKFWPSMQGLDDNLVQKIALFKQVIPIFTNVIFDTSQPHANTVFKDMFAWLDLLLETARHHPETLFIIRAHPDETRIRKASLETVAGWFQSRAAETLENVLFVPPQERLSSYELIARSKFVLIYNSTIGLEASILGAPVLCAGRARFTQYPTVFFPQSIPEYTDMLEDFLAADTIEIPAEFRRNARRFLYYQLFRTSLPFGDFLESGVRGTHARLKWFDPRSLPESQAIQTVAQGLLLNQDFLLDD